MKPEKHSVAVAVRHGEEPNRILLVLRPEDDEDLPSTWGLPAASLRAGEGWAEAARRAGREKLGVALRLHGRLGEGSLEREDYALRMRVFEAEILEGEPEVPQPTKGVTRYRRWKWGPAEALERAARAGSLCSRIFLRSRDRKE